MKLKHCKSTPSFYYHRIITNFILNKEKIRTLYSKITKFMNDVITNEIRKYILANFLV